MRSVKEKADQRPSISVHPTQRQCNAHGCPEIGSISHSNAGPAPSDSWFCRFHFGTKSTEWSEITRLRRIENGMVEEEAQ